MLNAGVIDEAFTVGDLRHCLKSRFLYLIEVAGIGFLVALVLALSLSRPLSLSPSFPPLSLSLALSLSRALALSLLHPPRSRARSRSLSRAHALSILSSRHARALFLYGCISLSGARPPTPPTSLGEKTRDSKQLVSLVCSSRQGAENQAAFDAHSPNPKLQTPTPRR